MKSLVFISLIGLIALFISYRKENNQVDINAIILDTIHHPAENDTTSYSKVIQHILVMHCSPCHFPGGKLHEELPFDRAETILHHQPGVLKRIKDPKELKLIKDFIQSVRLK